MIHLVCIHLGCCLDILSMCFVVASGSLSLLSTPVYEVFSQKGRLRASIAEGALGRSALSNAHAAACC